MASISINRKLDTYEAICDYARERSEALDTLRWKLGDCALLVMKKYSEKTMEDFARDIGQHKSTVYQYAKVSSSFPQSLRRRLKERYPNLNYSHMRDALRCTDRRAAERWLKEVSDNGWTADEASRYLTERLGREPRESIEGTIARRYDQEDGRYLVIRLHVRNELPVGQNVTIKVKAS